MWNGNVIYWGWRFYYFIIELFLLLNAEWLDLLKNIFSFKRLSIIFTPKTLAS